MPPIEDFHARRRKRGPRWPRHDAARRAARRARWDRSPEKKAESRGESEVGLDRARGFVIDWEVRVLMLSAFWNRGSLTD